MINKILSLIGSPQVYCEPFAGFDSLLFYKKAEKVEVVNDIRSEIVKVFRTLQDMDKFQQVLKSLESDNYEGPEEIFEAWEFLCRKQLDTPMETITWWHDRLTRVQIDNTDYMTCIKYWDTPNTTFYIEPPEAYPDMLELLPQLEGRIIVGFEEEIDLPFKQIELDDLYLWENRPIKVDIPAQMSLF